MRAAIAGCGTIAAVHARCLAGMQEVEIAAFADIRPERAENFAKEYGGQAYASITEMLEKEQIDVLHICLPHYLHVPVAIQAMGAGVNVFMEKPPVISREQLEQLKAAEEKASVQLGICFQNRYNPCTQAVKELLDSGKAGKIRGVRGLVTWSRGEAYYKDSGWRGTLEREGGGALINQSIHTMDLMTYLTGMPETVEASAQNHHLKGTIEVEDMLEAYIRYENGAVGCFYATTAYSGDPKPIIEFDCENMTIRMEDPDAVIYYPDGSKEEMQLPVVMGYGKSYWGSGHGACIRDYYGCLKENRPFWLNLRTLDGTIRLMLASYESARKGGEIAV